MTQCLLCDRLRHVTRLLEPMALLLFCLNPHEGYRVLYLITLGNPTSQSLKTTSYT
jgi:hypothetical protein